MSLLSLNETTIDDLESWLETIPFSKQRKSILKDFSDGVLIAEIIAHYLPRYVDLNLFLPANAVALKKYNWETLNKRVFPKLNFNVPRHLVDEIVAYKAGSIENVLINLRGKINSAMKNYTNGKRAKGRSYSSRAGSAGNLHYEPGIHGSSSSIYSAIVVDPPTNGEISKQTVHVQCNLSSFNDLVPSEMLYTTQQRLLEKEESLRVAEARVRHLEQLTEMKDRRIKYLTERLNTLLQHSEIDQIKHDSSIDNHQPDLSHKKLFD